MCLYGQIVPCLSFCVLLNVKGSTMYSAVTSIVNRKDSSLTFVYLACCCGYLPEGRGDEDRPRSLFSDCHSLSIIQHEVGLYT